MKQTEALKLALVALENSEKLFGDPEDRLMTDFDLLQNAITTIREALAEQPAQLDPSLGTQVSRVWLDGDKMMAQPIPLEQFYKEPEQPAQPSQRSVKPWVGLTEQEIEKLAVESGKATFLNDDEQTDILWFDGDCFGLARAIEAKLREKNA